MATSFADSTKTNQNVAAKYEAKNSMWCNINYVFYIILMVVMLTAINFDSNIDVFNIIQLIGFLFMAKNSTVQISSNVEIRFTLHVDGVWKMDLLDLLDNDDNSQSTNGFWNYW